MINLNHANVIILPKANKEFNISYPTRSPETAKEFISISRRLEHRREHGMNISTLSVNSFIHI